MVGGFVLFLLRAALGTTALGFIAPSGSQLDRMG